MLYIEKEKYFYIRSIFRVKGFCVFFLRNLETDYYYLKQFYWYKHLYISLKKVKLILKFQRKRSI